MCVENYHAALAAFRQQTTQWLEAARAVSAAAQAFDPENQVADPEAERIVGECITELRVLCLQLPGVKQMLLAALGALKK